MRQSKRGEIISLFGVLSAICLTFLGLAASQERTPDVPYVPTPLEVVEAMLAMAEVGEDDVLYDLGCGDGRIRWKAVPRYDTRLGARRVRSGPHPHRGRGNSRQRATAPRVLFGKP